MSLAQLKYSSKIVNLNYNKKVLLIVYTNFFDILTEIYIGKSKLKSENQQIFSKDKIVHIILMSLQHRDSPFDDVNCKSAEISSSDLAIIRLK